MGETPGETIFILTNVEKGCKLSYLACVEGTKATRPSRSAWNDLILGSELKMLESKRL